MTYDPDKSMEPGWFAAFLLGSWPYLLMLALALIGIALSSISPGRMIVFWEALVPAFAVICFAARDRSDTETSLLTVVRRDGLHWLAVFLAMRLLMLPDLSQMLNSDALALMLLAILALGTFTAGNQDGSWKIGLVGVLLGIAVPAVAWFERTALLIAIVCAAIVSVVLFATVRRA
jgi:hypothetical protein